MKKLWQKEYKLNEKAEAYSSMENVALDNKLIKYDVIGSIAHATMLAQMGILSAGELQKIKEKLSAILKLAEAGQFIVSFTDEDVHTKVENYLIEALGDTGKKIHTARSRNDQVFTDLKLFIKEETHDIALSTTQLAREFYSFAKKYQYVPMPGYTHMQKAMPSTVGMWAASFAESLLDDLQILSRVYELNDQSPLGSGAAYGVSLPIDRLMTAELLGFKKVQNNSLYSISSRPKNHLAIIQAVVQLMLTLSRFAQDVLLFTTSEFDLFTVAPELCTGSSIMPQKKNVDVMEIVRGRTHTLISYQQSVASIGAGLPSGYNSDFQETKKSLMSSLDLIKQSLEIVLLTIKTIKPNTLQLKKACTHELYATHAAYLLVKEGMPFRESYQKIAHSLNTVPLYDYQEILDASNHIGGPGKLGLLQIQKNIAKEKVWWNKRQKKYYQAIYKLLEGKVSY